MHRPGGRPRDTYHWFLIALAALGLLAILPLVIGLVMGLVKLVFGLLLTILGLVVAFLQLVLSAGLTLVSLVLGLITRLLGFLLGPVAFILMLYLLWRALEPAAGTGGDKDDDGPDVADPDDAYPED